MRHRNHPVFSVQYHPEAAPGPHDATYFFDEFSKLIDKANLSGRSEAKADSSRRSGAEADAHK
jgi:Glutamine amidotransferase class-I